MKITISQKGSFSFRFIGKYNFCQVKTRSSEPFSGYLVSAKLQQEASLDIKKLRDETPFARKVNYCETSVDCEKTPCMILINGNEKAIDVDITVDFFPMNSTRSFPTSGFGI
jgi:hypothetical protein